MTLHGQGGFELRCEWGEHGVATLSGESQVLIVVDVLSFSTCVDVAVQRGVEILPYPSRDASATEFARRAGAELAGARGEGRFSLSPCTYLDGAVGTRVVLPSPNGAALTLASSAPVTLTGCLRNAAAVAQAAAALGSRLAIVPAGERWRDGSLRPCLEDWLGAGAILQHLPGSLSPEARAARDTFRAARDELEPLLLESSSGRELVTRGYARDVSLAAQLDVSDSAPRFIGGAYLPCPGRSS